MYDPDLKLFEGVVTGNVTGEVVDYGGPDQAPMTFMIHVPQALGTGPKLTVGIFALREADDNYGSGVYSLYVQSPLITVEGDYFLTVKFNGRYRVAKLMVEGTSPNFGNVIIAPVPAGRDVNF